MNSQNFLMSSIVFLIEARNYDLAAHYMLKDAYQDNGHKNGESATRPVKNKLTGIIKRQHESLMSRYPKCLSIEQMREIARLVYEDIFQSLISDRHPEALIADESPGN
jgi:hypothetical protein